MGNPVFLQRCLRYKIQEKLKKRIQMTVCLMRNTTNWENVFPMYICLARQVSTSGTPTDTVYQIGRIFIFRNSPEVALGSEVQANFTLPEVNKLAKEARSGKLDVLFVSAATVEDTTLSLGVNSSSPPLDLNHLPFGESGENCLFGKIPLESLYTAWNYFPNFHLGQRAETCLTVDLLPHILKSNFHNEDSRVTIQASPNSGNMSTSKELHLRISAEEFGSKEKSSEPSASTDSEASSSSFFK